MVYPGLDRSRHRLDVQVMNQAGQPLLVTAAPPDADGCAAWPGRSWSSVGL